MSQPSFENLFDQFKTVSKDAWLQSALNSLGLSKPEELVWKPEEGLEINPYYNREDLEKLPSEKKLLLLSIGESLFQDNSWKYLETVFAKDFRIANKTALNSLSYGSNGILFSCLPSSKTEMEDLFKNIIIPFCSVSFKKQRHKTFNLNNYFNYIRENGYKENEIEGSYQFDPVIEWTFGKTDEGPDFEEVKKNILLSEPFPKFRPFTISAQVVKNSGANIVQEIAVAISIAISYVNHLKKMGITPAQVFNKIQFNTSIGTNFFFEISKIIALRCLIIKVANQYGVDLAPENVKIHAGTSLWHMSAKEPYNNILRNTTEAMAAIIGGCNSLSIYPHDFLINEPNEDSQKIARDISHILKEESYLDKVKNPASGSYYIESITLSMMEQAWKLVREIEINGGFTGAYKSGLITNLLKISYDKQLQQYIEENKKIIGVNSFKSPKDNSKTKLYFPESEIEGWFELKRLASAFERQ